MRKEKNDQACYTIEILVMKSIAKIYVSQSCFVTDETYG